MLMDFILVIAEDAYIIHCNLPADYVIRLVHLKTHSVMNFIV